MTEWVCLVFAVMFGSASVVALVAHYLGKGWD